MVQRFLSSVTSRTLPALVGLCALSGVVGAATTEDRVMISPITGKTIHAQVIPARTGAEVYRGVTVADMGTDSDGCRHSSGVSEYDMYVVTCPWSYFSALSIEWDEKGRFRGFLPQGFGQWVTSKNGFHSEWAIDRQHRYSKWKQIAASRGEAMPDINDWEMPQNEIPVDKRYRFAISSYSQRRYPAGFIAKIALTGSWAVRIHMNRPIFHSRLAGGVEEVNDRLLRSIKDGEDFNLDKWTSVYSSIFKNERLTDEGYFVAGTTLIGFLLRQGNVEETQRTVDALTQRFKDLEDGEILRGLVRERRRMLKQSYYPFLEQATANFRQAIANEEFPRPRLPEMTWAVAEGLRRLGQKADAMAWYTAVARMPETQKRVRDEIRAAGGAPADDAPYLLMLGWRADQEIERLKALDIPYFEEPAGSDASLIAAIIHKGLGTAEYQNPAWAPIQGGDHTDVHALLDRVGKAVLDYNFRMRIWPDSLDDMWIDGLVRDRNALNRFHDPVSGERLMYLRPAANARQDIVLISTRKAIRTPNGERYGNFLANNTIVWTEQPHLPGEVVQAQ